MRIGLHIADRPIDRWAIEYPIIPRIGDELIHPSTDAILLRVDSVLLHCLDRRSANRDTDAEIYCSVVND